MDHSVRPAGGTEAGRRREASAAWGGVGQRQRCCSGPAGSGAPPARAPSSAPCPQSSPCGWDPPAHPSTQQAPPTATGRTQVVRLHLLQPVQQRGIQLAQQPAQLLLLRGRPVLGRRARVLHVPRDAVVRLRVLSRCTGGLLGEGVLLLARLTAAGTSAQRLTAIESATRERARAQEPSYRAEVDGVHAVEVDHHDVNQVLHRPGELRSCCEQAAASGGGQQTPERRRRQARAAAMLRRYSTHLQVGRLRDLLVQGARECGLGTRASRTLATGRQAWRRRWHCSRLLMLN